MTSWVSVLVQAASSDSGSSPIGFGGHALIAVKHNSEYEVFHLVGARASTSGSGHVIYNSCTSIERYRCDEKGKAFSCGGQSGKAAGAGKPLRSIFGHSKWYESDLNKRLNIKETKRMGVKNDVAEKIIKYCLGLCRKKDVGEIVGVFSLIGGQVNMGTNCISWVYSVLKKHGITFDWVFYAMSFVSPRKAIESGGGLQSAG